MRKSDNKRKWVKPKNLPAPPKKPQKHLGKQKALSKSIT
jgi:hypothetical protein